MNNIKYLFLFSGIVLLLFSSCSNMPEHARLIPANAIVVAGINTKEIGKKIAWNAIIGSKLFDEMKKQQPEEMQDMFDPEKMGVELMSTSYVYIKSDNRFDNNSWVIALIPLEDADKWDAFVRTTFSEAEIQQNNDHKDAMLADGMYAGWNNDVLIIMNTHKNAPATPFEEQETDTIALPTTLDKTELIAEMDNAFHIAKEQAITENERFNALEKNGHDITLWINYEVLMGEYAGKGMADMIGLPLSNALWKDAALAAGFDFEKGSITGDLHYYMPEEMKETGIVFGKDNIDKEMVNRLPGEQMDMLIASHISPKGVKSMLEKMGVSGFINLALSTQGISTDYILEAITGDVVVSVNKFRLERKQGNDSMLHEQGPAFDGDAQYTYAIKINKKENFNKLLAIAEKNGILTRKQGNSYTLGSGEGGPTMVNSEFFFVISNNVDNITNYLSDKYKKNSLPPAVKDICNYPMGFYFNAQGMMNTINTGIVSTAKDSATLYESKKLLKDVVFKGGTFTNKAFKYQMEINFLNKQENSLLLLMDFATKINNSRKEALMAKK